ICKSVPQIEAAFTRTSTSPCPTSGTGTLSIRNPRAASIFRSAFIVAAIPASSSLRHQLLNAQSQILAHWPAHLCPGRRVPPTPPLRVGSSSTSIPSTHPRIDATCHPEGIRRGCPKDLNANLVTHSTREATSPKWISTMRALLHLLHHPNLLHRLQILHHQPTRPDSAHTASRNSCAFLFPSLKFNPSYAYSSPPPHNPSYSNNFGF